MTGWGKKLAGIDEEQLRQQLRTETDPKAVKRLTVALRHAKGSSPYEIERLLGIPAQTVYEFGGKLTIVLDNASYFIAKTLKKRAAADDLPLEFLPSHSPEMNPLENCWRQFREGRANPLFRTLDDVNEYL